MRFDAVFNIWLTLIIVVLIALVLAWFEWQRPYKFKASRILAVLLLMIALAGIFLRPAYEATKTSSILLLTQDYSSIQIDSLIKAHPSIHLRHFENTLPYKNSEPFFYYDLADQGNEIRFILGQGLPTHALDLWEEKKYAFIASELSGGITGLNFPSTIHVNRKTAISGTIDSRKENEWLFLKSPGAKEDSIKLSRGKNNFDLSFTPRSTGNFLYTLSADSSSEVVPVHVEVAYPIRILFLQHHPTFETQQLKQFLGRKKHLVIVRNQVSKNNFRYEYINTSPLQVNRLTKTTLDNFDLVIADEESLQILSATEREILVQNIRSGLGLLHVSSNNNRKRSILFPFETNSIKTDTAQFSLEDRSFNLPAAAIRIRENSDVTPIQKNKSRILSGYTFSGTGKVGFQLLQETYRLTLSGDSAAYASLWTPLLENIARIKSADSKIKITTPFPRFENEPIDIEIISSSETPIFFSDRIRIPIQEDPTIDNVWYARTWPTAPGWHALTTEGGTSLPYYVFKRNSWRTLAVAHQMEMTRKVASSTSVDHQSIKYWKEIPAILWYVIFLLTAGFLWLAPKL